MKRNFVELQKFLTHRFPELTGSIKGQTYPPPPHAETAVYLASLIQMSLLAAMFFGSKLFEMAGVPEPHVLKAVQENKMMTFMGTFILNSWANSLTATGAFEVSLDGQLVFSKLEQGHMPTAREIIEALEQAGFAGQD